MGKASLTIFSDKSEDIDYNFSGFPLYINSGKIEDFTNYAASNHWHYDLEYLYVVSGTLEYFVNGTVISLNSGQCIFVNSRRMHYGYSQNHCHCKFIVIAIHPNLFGNENHLLKNYWTTIFNDLMENFKLYDIKNNDHKALIDLILAMNRFINDGKDNLFYLLAKASELVFLTGETLHPLPSISYSELSWKNFSDMVEYIYQHYDQKLLVDDIANIGDVCRNHCYDLFKRYAQTTPLEFLNNHRLKKSLELLAETNRSITEIAVSCGFQSNSYYTYLFRLSFNRTPKEYRKLHH